MTATTPSTAPAPVPATARAARTRRPRRARRAVQTGGFVRKETVSILRQPRLLAVLVAGPFLILLLFGLGFDQQQTVLRTAFIGQPGSVYEDAVEQFADDLSQYVDSAGFSDDLDGAIAELRDGELDAVVVFPNDPVDTVLGGEQAEIVVLHDKLDPLQQVAVEVSTQVAVMELNARVWEGALTRLQDSATPVLEAVATELDTPIGQIDVGDVGGVGDVEGVDDVDDLAARVAEIDPELVVRPFSATTESLQREPVTTNDFFAPGAIALLVQHMVLTFAAMSLVTDRALGLFEIYRVGPIDASRLMLGKYLAFLMIGAVVAAALIAAVVGLLGVPLRGDLAWVAVGIAGLALASIGFGMTVSLLARSDVQAVQYSMLVLLASLFFGGLFLDLDAFSYPVRLVCLVLPVSYGIELLRDVMLRGTDPALTDLVGLGATTVGFALVTWWLLHRQLRVR